MAQFQIEIETEKFEIVHMTQFEIEIESLTQFEIEIEPMTHIMAHIQIEIERCDLRSSMTFILYFSSSFNRLL